MSGLLACVFICSIFCKLPIVGDLLILFIP
jgi:hypothetical protein